MSVTVTKADGVTTVVIITTTSGSWPPLLAALCYNPLCCSVSQKLSRIRLAQTVLGVMQIMVGLLNIALGAVRINVAPTHMAWLGVPYWLGAVFIAAGIMCVLAGKFHSPCLVTISVLMNLVGVALAITGIVFYTTDLGENWRYWDEYEARDMLVKALAITLIILVVLQFCLNVSSAVLSLKALCHETKPEEEEGTVSVNYQPLVEDPHLE